MKNGFALFRSFVCPNLSVVRKFGQTFGSLRGQLSPSYLIGRTQRVAKKIESIGRLYLLNENKIFMIIYCFRLLFLLSWKICCLLSIK